MKLRTKIKSWAIDYTYMVRGALGAVIFRRPPKHYLGYVVDGKVPVVIIPGVFGKWGFMKKMADAISLLGHPVYIVSELGYNLFTIPHSASLVSHLLVKENLHNVIIVAHSKGGLIGKYTLIHHNEGNRIIGMVSLATPYSGSGMTKLLPVEPIKELHNDSAIILDIKRHTHVNHMITSISPMYDNHVWAEEGSYLEGAKNIKIDVHGHHKIIYDKEVITTVKDSIEEITKKKYQSM